MGEGMLPGAICVGWAISFQTRELPARPEASQASCSTPSMVRAGASSAGQSQMALPCISSCQPPQEGASRNWRPSTNHNSAS